eukprot:TRINITY_DN81105_c0_g1_i1.p1 TRINITY_DN81105_c0_g1~~TRINITY_DN81105_c0_g1_i1.p1  ORF type:complete len:300 (+),score=34.27 TRINITY_DN81105_c0_g1_i1:96-902(+)
MATSPSPIVFSTRPSRALSVAEGTDAQAELLSLRAKRREAYQANRSMFCPECCPGRRSGCCCRLFALVLSPLSFLATLLQLLFASLIHLIASFFGCLFRAHFWVGVVAASIAISGIASSHCIDMSGPASEPSAHLHYVCKSDSPFLLEARDRMREVVSLVEQARLQAMQIASDLEHRVYSQILGRSCRFRNENEARFLCLGGHDEIALRRATDCAALRRAYHDGQRNFHPDKLQLQYPSCSLEVLEACSIFLNLALEGKKTELGCPQR